MKIKRSKVSKMLSGLTGKRKDVLKLEKQVSNRKGTMKASSNAIIIGVAKIQDRLALLLRNTKIKTRLIVALTILLLIPILAISVFSVQNSTQIIKNKVVDFSNPQIKLLGSSIQSTLEFTKSELTSAMLSKNLQDKLDKYEKLTQAQKDEFAGYVQNVTLKKYIDDKNIASVCITTKDGTVVGGKGYNENNAKKILDYLDKDKTKFEPKVLDFSDDPAKSDFRLSMSARISSLSIGGDVGNLLLVFQKDFLYNIYKDNIMGKDSKLLILDSNGTVLSSNDSSIIGKAFGEAKAIEPVIKTMKSKTIKIDGSSYYTSATAIDSFGWNVVNMVSNGYFNSQSNMIRNIIIGIGTVIFLIVLLVSFLMSNSIANPLKSLSNSIEQAKAGVMKARVDDMNDDELGEISRSFNDMMRNMNLLIGNAKEISGKILSNTEAISGAAMESHIASGDIASSMSEVAKGANSQAVGMNDIVGYLDQLKQSISVIEAKLTDTIQVVQHTVEIGDSTRKAVDVLEEKSMATSSVAERISTNVNELDLYMGQISEAAKLIVEVSEQTNLLALNASIEAARAGEIGKGFKIVSEQVKKLAEQSRDASMKINVIIQKLTNRINGIEKNTSRSQLVMSKQNEAIVQTNSYIQSITNGMEKVKGKVQGFTESVNQISKLNEITFSAIEGISTVSEQTAAITEEVTASAEGQIASMQKLTVDAGKLNKMIEKMNNTISLFEV